MSKMEADLSYGMNAVPLGVVLAMPIIRDKAVRQALDERVAAAWTGGGIDAPLA